MFKPKSSTILSSNKTRNLRWVLLVFIVLVGGILFPAVIFRSISAAFISSDSDFQLQKNANDGPDLEIKKVHTGDIFAAPDGGTFTITVKNISNQVVTGPVTVTDVLEHKLISNTLESASGWDPCSFSGNSLTCVYSNTNGIPKQTTLPLVVFNARFAATSASVLTNTVNLSNPSDSNPQNNTYSDLIILNSADLVVDKKVNNPNPLEGEAVTFTVNASNKGPDAATNVILFDKLPTGLTYITSTVTAGDYSPSTGHWQIGTFAKDRTVQLKITARVDIGTFNETLSNQAKYLPVIQYDPNLSNNQASAKVSIAPSVDLQISKDDGFEYVFPNLTTDFTVAITNAGNLTATGIIITDRLGVDYSFITDTLDITETKVSTNTFVWYLEQDLGPGDGQVFFIEARVNEPLSDEQDIVNTIMVSADQAEGNLENNTDSDSNKAVYLDITKTVKPKRATVGEALVFDISVSNPSDYPAYDVFLVDTFPDYMDITRATTTKGFTPRIDNTAHNVLVDIGVVDPDKPVQIIIDTRVNDRARGFREPTNKAELNGKTPDLILELPTITGFATYTVIGEVLPSTGGMEVTHPPAFYLDPDLFVGLALGSTGLFLLCSGLFSGGKRPKLAGILIAAGLFVIAAGCSINGAHQQPPDPVQNQPGNMLSALQGTKPALPPTSLPNTPSGLPPATGNVPEISNPPSQAYNTPATAMGTSSQGEPEAGQQSGFQEAWQPDDSGQSTGALPDYPIPQPDTSAQPLPGQDHLDITPPEWLEIPIIGVNAPVKYVPYKQITWLVAGLTREIAWMGDTSWPGLGSNTAMAGHVTMRDGSEGPFRRLQVLNPGDDIFLETGDYHYTYQVRDVVVIPDYEFSVVESTAEPQLTLVTCTAWDEELQVYLERLVVYADLMEITPR